MAARESAPDSGDLVRVGRVAKAHGIKGELKVHPDFGPPEDFLDYQDVILLYPDTDLRRDFKVSRCRPQANIVILQLENIADRTSAEKFAGCEVWIDKASLAALPKGKHHWHDLIGLQVETEGGRKLGLVQTLFATGGDDILVVLGDGREYLIPLRKEFLIDTDYDAGIMTVAEVPGLFEIND